MSVLHLKNLQDFFKKRLKIQRRVASTILRKLLQDGEKMDNMQGPLPVMTNLWDTMAIDQAILRCRA